MQRGPNSSALRTPLQFFTGWGSRQRRLPTGGWPKGIPLKLRTPSLGGAFASRRPLAILTRSAATDGCVAAAHSAKTESTGVKSFIWLPTHQDSITGSAPAGFIVLDRTPL